MKVAGTPSVIPLLQLLVGVLYFDDRPVDQHTDRDRDPAERHHVDAETHEVERDEGEDYRDRNRQNGHDGARKVPEKNENHEGDDDDLLDQLVLQVVDGTLDELGPIVGRHDLEAGRQRRLDVAQLLLDALDDVERVLALAHHDDPADGVSLAVEVRDAPPDLRPEGDVPDVAHR